MKKFYPKQAQSLKPFFAILLTLVSIAAFSQTGGVSISPSGGSSSADPSAALDISSYNNKGVLMPQMTTAQMNAIVNPATGLTIFNTDCNVYDYNAGTPSVPNWVTMNSANALAAGVSISASPAGAICSGTSVTYTATPANGINSPNYQWQVNGGNVGTNSSTYTSTSLNNGDAVTCILSSGAACVTGSPATSNSITTFVNLSPATPGSISGNTNPLGGSSGNVYSISPVNNATTYAWSVPSGYSITLGQGTTSITVTIGTDTGNISVTAGTCPSPASSLAVFPCGYVPGTDTLKYTGSQQTFTVPCAVSSVNISVYGAQGAPLSGNLGGSGGYATGTLSVTTGQVLYVYVGGQGSITPGAGSITAGGFNGGGNGYSSNGGGGGGASDVRIGGTALSNRVIVAGGGGGGNSAYNQAGGSGGDTNGGNALWFGGTTNQYCGYGGTQSSGGSNNTDCGGGTASALGQGGVAGTCEGYGCGGGGGYYGGGGGSLSGGGGGSGYIGGVTSGSMQTGVQSGNGQVIITW